MTHHSRRTGFTLVELLVVVGIAMLLLVLLVPAVGRAARESDNRARCARNLKQLGQAMLLYANGEKNGSYPRAPYTRDGSLDTSNAGASLADTFDGKLGKNNIGASLFLLLRTQDISPDIFVCPSTDCAPDKFGGGTNTAMNRANFTDLNKNLSYSVQNMFADTTAVSSGFKWNNSMNPDMAMLADKNPGVTPPDRDNVFAPKSASDPADKQWFANSNNHAKEGQNVLFADGHVEFVVNPWVGVSKDNIYTRSGTTEFGKNFSPADANDSFLLPTDSDDGKAGPDSGAASRPATSRPSATRPATLPATGSSGEAPSAARLISKDLGYFGRMAFLDRGATVLCTDGQNHIALRRASDGEVLGRIEVDQTITCLAVSPDEKVAATGSPMNTVTLCDLTKKAVIGRLRRGGTVTDVAFCQDGKTLAVADIGGYVSFWNWETQAFVTDVRLNGWGGVYFHRPADGRSLLVYGQGGTQGKVMDFDGKILAEWTTENKAVGRGPLLLTMSQDGSQMVCGGADGVWLRDRSGKVVATVFEKTTGVTTSEFSADGKLLLIATGSRVEVWDTQAKKLLEPVPALGVLNLAIKPDNKLIAAVDGRTVTLWELGRDTPVASLPKGTEPMRVQFSPDGRVLYTFGKDRSLRAWDLTLLMPATAPSR